MPAGKVLPSHAAGPGGKACLAGQVEKTALEIVDLKTNENVASVVRALEGLQGVKSAVVDLNTRLAVVDYDPGKTWLPDFVAACREAGFTASEYRVEDRFPKPIKLKGG
jgi:copper chaperone CopZ